MKFIKPLLYILFIAFIYCKNTKKENQTGFKLVKRNFYVVNSVNGLNAYYNSDTGQPLNGYYIVGNKLNKWEEFEVDNGLLKGEYIIYHPNGKAYSKTTYSNGKKHGEERFFLPDGTLSKLNNYKNDKLYGTSYLYFNNGQIHTKSKIKKEEVIESVSYNLIGEIESQMFINDGLKITQTINAGKIVVEKISSTYDNFEAVKFYNEDGSLEKFLRIITNNENPEIIELDENKNEIKRVNLKTNPEEIETYRKYFGYF
ncbi:toxin-antitoxin system YwqK family antitoxin [Neotamlana laminarinivorans]|uniref:Antitoxin component YwqK of YwqJK toxin-antitoxin module n=1 Tax=Neotamlana laminarinivorans TaxID=2883124 RepID=A0A9X1I108_9FLAO|nr:hypothetical protein [Tamlana laminarinivorans]MCB4798212.1 hypothetical protein [Tamlana laminarinivorans]